MRWYSEAGVDIAMSDETVDRFLETAEQLEKRQKPKPVSASPSIAPAARLEKPTAAAVQPKPMAQPHVPTVPNEEAAAKSRDAAKATATLAELKDKLLTFEACNLKFTARSTVFSDGKPDAETMIIGGAPDRDEDEQGIPFVGNRGQLFDKMLASIQLDRKSTYLTCVLPWRPPGNRAPSPAEVDICRPLIERHIELVSPKTIVLVGSLPAQILLGTKGSVMSLRGKWSSIDVGENSIPTLSMLNPAYLLQNPGHKRLAWNDLLILKQHLKTLNSDT